MIFEESVAKAAAIVTTATGKVKDVLQEHRRIDECRPPFLAFLRLSCFIPYTVNNLTFFKSRKLRGVPLHLRLFSPDNSYGRYCLKGVVVVKSCYHTSCKGILAHRQDGIHYVYKALTTKESAQKSAVRNLVSTLFYGKASGAVVAILDFDGTSLTEEEIEQIRRKIR